MIWTTTGMLDDPSTVDDEYMDDEDDYAAESESSGDEQPERYSGVYVPPMGSGMDYAESDLEGDEDEDVSSEDDGRSKHEMYDGNQP